MRPEDDSEVLRDLYVTQRMSMYAIADALGVSKQLVSRRLDHFEIPKRSARDYAKSHTPKIAGMKIRDPKLAERLGLRS